MKRNTHRRITSGLPVTPGSLKQTPPRPVRATRVEPVPLKPAAKAITLIPVPEDDDASFRGLPLGLGMICAPSSRVSRAGRFLLPRLATARIEPAHVVAEYQLRLLRLMPASRIILGEEKT